MAFDAHVNFGYSTVATAPSPASSGTSLVVAAGEGADFPAPPFNAVVWPAGVNPRKSTAEVVRVTAISTDTFTITRAQESSSARTVVVGDQIADAETAKTLTDIEGALNDGWVVLGDTLSYSSADSPTFVASTTIDLSGVIPVGARIKLTQTTAKYFIVTAIDSTTITLYGGTDYTLANAAISSPYYSLDKTPNGFPANPNKWTVEVTDTSNATQSNPVSGTWYNLGSISISLPIGCWRVYYGLPLQVTRAASGSMQTHCTLSTANNTESDATLSSMIFGSALVNIIQQVHREKVLAVAAKTSYFLNAKAGVASMTGINFRGDLATTVIRAVCAYL